MNRAKRSRTRGRLLWILALALPAAALVYGAGPGRWFGGGGEVALEGAVVRRGPLSITVTERGNLEAKNKQSLKNEVEGRTSILYLIEEGTRVKAGDVVAELDATSLVDRRVQQQDKVLNARATLTKAKANLDIQRTENESLLARAEQKLDFAKQDLAKYIDGDWPQELQEADESILLAEAELKNAEQQYEWSKRLQESGFLTRTELERDELAFDRSRIQLEQRKRDKQLKIDYENPRRLAELRGNVEEAERDLRKVRLQAEAQIVDHETAVQTATARLNLEERELAKLDDQIRKAIVRAPVDGMVVYGREEGSRWGGGEPVKLGGEVRERQEIASIPSSGQMVAEASIHESVLKQIQVGQQVIVRVDAIPAREFRGRVEFVAPLPDKNSWWANPNLRLYKTQVSIADETEQMRPGMSCNVEILVDELPDTLYVPLQSVVNHRGKHVAFVRTVGGVEQREVEIGPHNAKWVSIRAGLREGEVVLLAPPQGFKPESAPETSGEGAGPGEAPGEGYPQPAGGAPAAPGAAGAAGSDAGGEEGRRIRRPGGEGAQPGTGFQRPEGGSARGERGARGPGGGGPATEGAAASAPSGSGGQGDGK